MANNNLELSDLLDISHFIEDVKLDYEVRQQSLLRDLDDPSQSVLHESEIVIALRSTRKEIRRCDELLEKIVID